MARAFRDLKRKVEGDMKIGAAATPFTGKLESTPREYYLKHFNFDFFDGLANPDEHLNYFEQISNIYDYSDLTRCRFFASTLKGEAQKWFSRIPSRSVDSWRDFREIFLKRFRANQMNELYKSTTNVYQIANFFGLTCGGLLGLCLLVIDLRSLMLILIAVDCIMKAILPEIQGDLATPLLSSKSVQDNEQSQGKVMQGDNLTENQALLDKGYLEYGCPHTAKRCRIRAPCCNEIFGCLSCHDESKSNLDKDGHKMPRNEVRQVICSLCNTEQEFQQICINCGVCMGRYICGICKVISDDPSEKIKHCHSCGKCRRGRPDDQIIHCNKCQCCREEPHTCIEGLLHRNCHICSEYLFETTGAISALPCGHIIHHPCFPDLMKSPNTCPVCFKTFADRSGRNTTWRLQLHQLLRMFNKNWYYIFTVAGNFTHK
ncbi:uncharacterized protein LOC141674406 [Apium graveolens]|uniref:uncharacterized protein LOC141674406 n=1 Tax=Apium graveolens TaxID=4045 RepID=UPI003D7B969E